MQHERAGRGEVQRLADRGSAALQKGGLPAIRCGQHSLEIFCLGVFLAFAGQFIIAESSGGPLLQTAISVLGIIIMIATANLVSWYKAIEGRSPVSRVKSSDADLAGGEA